MATVDEALAVLRDTLPERIPAPLEDLTALFGRNLAVQVHPLWIRECRIARLQAQARPAPHTRNATHFSL